MDHSFKSVELFVVDVDIFERASHAGQEAEELFHRAHPAERLHLREEVVHGELTLREFFGHFLGLFVADLFPCLLDKCEHVTHTENPPGHALWAEFVERVKLLAGTDELDWCAGDLLHRERRAAARVAVEFGEDHAVNLESIMKCLCTAHGVLPGHRIDDKQDLVGLNRSTHGLKFFHEVVVHVKPTSGVEDHNVVALAPSFLNCAPTDTDCRVDRLSILRTFVRFAIKTNARAAPCIGIDAVDNLLQLFDSGWSLKIRRRYETRPASLLEKRGEFAAGCGLSGALQAAHHDYSRSRINEKELAIFGTHQCNQLIVHDADKLLAGLKALCDFLAGGFREAVIAKLLGHTQLHVRFEERRANLRKRVAHIGFTDRSAA